MTIDDKITIIGSFNYTGPANLINDEYIIVLGDMDESDPARQAAHGRMARYARDEIE